MVARALNQLINKILNLSQCESISLEEDFKTQWIRILYPEGLISSNNPTKREWYSNGTVELDINEWNIKVKYSSDKKTAPTYEANKGAEKITGTLVFPEE